MSQITFFPPVFVLTIIILNLALILILLIMLLKQVSTSETKSSDIHNTKMSGLSSSIAQHGYAILNRSISAIYEKNPIDALLNLITNTYMNLSDSDGGIALLFDDYTDTLSVKAFVGFFSPAHKLPDQLPLTSFDIGNHFRTSIFSNNNTFYEKIAKEIQKEIIIDASLDPRITTSQFLPEEEKSSDAPIELQADSYMALPLKINDVVCAVIMLCRKKGQGQFSTMALDKLSQLSEFSSIALKNILCFNEIEKKTQTNIQQQLATKIQKDLYTQRIPHFPHAELYTYFNPFDGICSDFFDVITTKNNKLCIVLGDIIGKDMGSIMTMQMLKTTVNIIANTSKPASTLMQWINRVLIKEKKKNQFASLSLLLFDYNQKQLQCSNASTNPFLLYRPTEQEWITLSKNTSALGVHKHSEYGDYTLTVQDGDIVILCTDGIVECTNEHGKQYTVERLKTIIENFSHLKGKDILQNVKSDIIEYSNKNVHCDDQSLVLLMIHM